MTNAEQREAARKFINTWHGKGYEKGDTQRFWMALLSEVLGMDYVADKIEFEKEVVIDGQTKYIDGYIAETKVLIEQKSLVKDLNKPIPQSGGKMMTPYEQAKNYANNLPVDEAPRWIVTCNFSEFHIYDMNKPGADPEVVRLENLQTEIYRFTFLLNEKIENVSKEMEISIQAGDIVGDLYDELLKQYKEPDNEESLKSLNALCVRLVFCLYAEDAGIFGRHGMFHDYLMRFEIRDLRKALIELFKVLDTKAEDRDPYMDVELAEFPYVNGGLFSDDNIEIPQLTENIRELILKKASEDFDWSDISPTIFGAVFESTLNPETRRSGGMHYTSIENIHKVIDPLFLDELKEELESIREISVAKTKGKKLDEFQQKLASLNFLDPACGSGNFLTESYICIRRIENEVLKLKIEVEKGQVAGQITFGNIGDNASPIKVSIGQFYGIEINDFAVTVAKTALWIAESQMMKETEDVVHMNLNFLPLKSYANVIEGNALRMDWNDIVSKEKLNYIMGNPPFVSQGGSSNRGQRQSGAGRSKDQADDMKLIFGNEKGSGNLDYVSCWYKKAFQLIKTSTHIEVAFVATNSICQGQQVAPLWKTMFDEGLIINFAHNSFEWDSETNAKAVVYVVIIGFSMNDRKDKYLYYYDDYKRLIEAVKVEHINAYLLANSPDVFIETRTKPICNVSKMVRGGGASDWGYLMLSEEEKNELIRKEPEAQNWVRPFLQGNEFIKGIPRYCLWMEGISPNEIKRMPRIKERIEAVKTERLKSKKASTRRKAETPWLFDEIIKIESEKYIAIPQVSAGSRRYIPIGYVPSEYIAGNKLLMLPDGTLVEFAILTSNVHNAWMRVVASHYGPSYQYSANIAYNNFPWPQISEEQKKNLEITAQAILEARALYPDSSLADLYDPLFMPQELRKAHQANDRAVMKAYGFNIKEMSEADCVAELMKMYKEITKG